MIRRILALIVKEFLAILKDPRSRFAVVGPPLIQMVVFGYAATYDLNHVPLAVYDEDRSPASRELLAGFEGSGNFRRVATLGSQEQIAPLLDSRGALLVIHVGPQFSRDLLAGRTARVQVLLDGRNSNTAMVALGYARRIVTDFNEAWSREHGLSGLPARLETRAWFNPNLLSRWFIVPGIAGVLVLVVATLVTSMSVSRERESGTFDQLLVTPLRPHEILIGKAAPGFLIGLGEATLIILVAQLWFGVPLRGDLLTLYAGIAVFLLSVVGVGLMISALSVTMQQSLLGTFLFLMPSVILSGYSTPIENMPEAVQYVTYLNPLRYLMVILRGVFLEGTPLRMLTHQFWPMAVIGVVCMTLAGWLFRHRMH